MPSITLTPVGGCYVWEGATQVAPYQSTDPIMTNYGSTGVFRVGTEGGKNSSDSIAFLHFDLGGSTGAWDPSQRDTLAATGVIPLNAIITRIQLKLWVVDRFPVASSTNAQIAMCTAVGYANYQDSSSSFARNRLHYGEASWNFKSTFSGSTGIYWADGIGKGPINTTFDYNDRSRVGATGATGPGYWYTLDSLYQYPYARVDANSTFNTVLALWDAARKRWPGYPGGFTLTANYPAYPHNFLTIHIRRVADGNDYRFFFYSHLYSDPTYRPQLIIDYIIPSMDAFFNNSDRIN